MDKTKLIPVSVAGRCATRSRATVSARHHVFEIDERKDIGGSDLGPSPLEMLMASFIGCTNVIAHRIAQEQGVRLADLEIAVTGMLDYGVVLGTSASRVAFPLVRLSVKGRTDANGAQLRALREALAARCPVSVILRASGARVEETWNLEAL